MNRVVILVLIGFVGGLLNSCVKDSEEIIPNIHFTGQIELINQDPSYTQNQSFIIEYDSYGKRLGLYGVVVFKLYDEEFYAFDLMCPHEKSISALVEISEVDGNENYGYCTCPECGSEFSVNSEYGGLVNGPSKWSLKRYNTEVRNGTLHIWN